MMPPDTAKREGSSSRPDERDFRLPVMITGARTWHPAVLA
jgi:hypothetical protein